MKAEIIIYIIVIILSVSTPIFAYFTMSNTFSDQAEMHLAFSGKLDLTANKIESGEEKVHLESIPCSLRLEAKAERSLAESFTNFDSAAQHYLEASLWTAFVQIVLLFGLLRHRKRNI